MITFDQAHLYQFSLFLDETEPLAEGLAGLPSLLSRAVPGINLKLRLGQAELGQALVVQPTGSVVPGGVMSWKAGSGIWRVVLTPSRLDVHFDARGYADLMDEFVFVVDVAQRIVRNLSEVPATLGQRVTRLALIVTGQASCAKGEPRPSHAVARTFFNQPVLDAEERGELADTVARTNRVATWHLREGAGGVRVNRNETGTGNVVIRGGTEETSLSWQWDVNTSGTLVAAANFEALDIAAFFHQAEAWVRERAEALQALR